MERDAHSARREKPFVLSNMKTGAGVADIVTFIESTGGLRQSDVA